MRLITREIDYAIRALCYMAGGGARDEAITVHELARRLKAPLPFLRRILQTLSREGLVQSSKGIGGGFRLSREPEEITLSDIVLIFRGRLKLGECMFRKKLCPDVRTCMLKKRIGEIERQVIGELEKTRLSSLLPE